MQRRTCLITLSTLAMSAAGCASAPGGAQAAPMLSQEGNPLNGELASYRRWLSGNADAATALAADRRLADHIVSWQMAHGGFYKETKWYAAAWNGTAPRSGWFGAGGTELGTIDNGATVSEICVLADVYGRGGNTVHRDAARRAMDFLLRMQYPSGGYPQVYPARTGTVYSNNATFNDNAMVRVLKLLDDAARQRPPFAGDVFTAQQRTRMEQAIGRAEDFILKAQIVQDGVKTVWCAQHDPVTHAPVTGRSFELPSKSGLESVLVIAFLMSRPQTPAVAAAAKAGVAWYRRGAVQMRDTAFDPRATRPTGADPFVRRPGSTTWYRFYDLATDTGFFCGRQPTDKPPGAGKQYDIMKIGAESRYTYQWGGNYGDRILAYAERVGY
ncbi:pectate lyase [Pseudoduganella lutea]|uniref:Pectate lyase n=1 Tax=Pseudoduganella lutea TaxID=321985 RepID=A0A4P6L593_9BURK|nr:pectate lyase [Pseudoduganella lutea]QBE66624.1 pectate lyase [Pseudoduganella lutea]